jgi:hypothetical protein
VKGTHRSVNDAMTRALAGLAEMMLELALSMAAFMDRWPVASEEGSPHSVHRSAPSAETAGDSESATALGVS